VIARRCGSRFPGGLDVRGDLDAFGGIDFIANISPHPLDPGEIAGQFSHLVLVSFLWRYAFGIISCAF